MPRRGHIDMYFTADDNFWTTYITPNLPIAEPVSHLSAELFTYVHDELVLTSRRSGRNPFSRSQNIVEYRVDTGSTRIIDVGRSKVLHMVHSGLSFVTTSDGFYYLHQEDHVGEKMPDVPNSALNRGKRVGVLVLDSGRKACLYENLLAHFHSSTLATADDLTIRFNGTCKKAFVHGSRIIVVCEEDFIEIRDASNGSLVQIIEGEKIDAWPSYGISKYELERRGITDSGFMLTLRNPLHTAETLVLDVISLV